ncbi:Maf family protein [Lachnoanaerobaculum saburreum]|uniref:dTTP/UTP pyrophosphatase n=1 Tax=Lachnoanaerobaculum saburreum TaxID=467210 RepID=A0A133ZY99_9FIRM|nr:Maf family protein [Lachnoanaerobaculum saburreum]KXB60433.1 septum formation protein Maf [Lachnoanaerobaculum saburreum]
MNNIKIILASASPRRKELLEQIGVDFEIAVSDKETAIDCSDPVEACRKQAYNKAVDIVEKSKLKYSDKDFVVISADTIVAIDKKILGKPKDKSDARQMLKSLSGRKHRVYTAVCVYNSLKDSYESFVEDTPVEVARLSSEEIEDYLEKKEPYDKAGAYAIQGYFSRYIVGIEGDYYNVMGLPVGRLYREYLKEL